MQAGRLNRRLTILRAVKGERAGLGERKVTWEPAVPPETVWASREDVSDGELARAGATVGTQRSRFVVRATRVTRSVTLEDRVTVDGLTWAVIGIKETDGRVGLEWTGDRRSGDSL